MEKRNANCSSKSALGIRPVDKRQTGREAKPSLAAYLHGFLVLEPGKINTILIR